MSIPAVHILRWGEPYASLDVREVGHFLTGEPVARVGQANAGLIRRDMKRAARARAVLREMPARDLLERLVRAADLYMNATLPLGDGGQSPEDFARAQSATTGLPERLCRANMEKNHFVLTNMAGILDALTRGLDLEILSRGHGVEARGGREVGVSYQAQTPALGLVLPSNSPGVHTLWLPVVAMQIGLVLKPGSQEIWTPYRMAEAFFEAGIPREAIGIYPGEGADVGAEVVASCPRSLIFGGPATVERYRGDPRVQVHGPGFSKILIGEDRADRWEEHIDLIAESAFKNAGRSCINASGVWTPRHAREIAEALAERLGPVEPAPPDDPDAALAAFTVEGQGRAVWQAIESELKTGGVEHATERFGPRLIEKERCAYLRPVVVHCASPDPPIANREFMFPFVSVVECPQSEMLGRIGPTLVCTAITEDEAWRRELIDATHIDRLNLGPIPTTRLDWFQPHEGNIVEFLFRARSFQSEPLA